MLLKKQTSCRKQLAMLLAGAATLSISVAADAQAAPDQGTVTPAAPSESESADIVVTAQRRGEQLKDVPVAVTALSAETAMSSGIRTLQDVQIVTPGLSFGSSYTYASPYIRGVGANLTPPGLENPVAIYVDGVYVTRSSGSVSSLVDADGIEILRGPQGSLYGRNATGGVILLKTAEPDKDLAARFAAEYGRFDRVQLDGMVNVPLSDDLSMRVAGRYADGGNYIINIPDDKKSGGSQDELVRSKLKWTPGGETEILLSAEYSRQVSNIDTFALRAGAPTCLACVLVPGLGPVTDYYKTNQNTPAQVENEAFGTTLDMRFQLGAVALRSLTAYRYLITRGDPTDQDFTPVNFLGIDTRRGAGGRTYSQDFQLTSSFDGPINFIVGTSLLWDRARFNADFLGLAFGGLAPGNDTNINTDSYAAYAEGTYQATDRLKLTVGGRYSIDKRAIQGINNPDAALVFGVTTVNGRKTFRSFTPRFVLAYDSPAGNIYYSFSRGFKAGGFNAPATAPLAPIDPEKIFSHEIGWKPRLAGGAIALNFAGFYQKSSNLQQQIFDLTTGAVFTQNAGGAEAYGLEFDGQFRTGGLTLGVAASYIHSEYTSYPNASAACPSTNAVNLGQLVPCSINLSGKPTARSPKFQGSLNANYKFAVGAWDAAINGVISHTSSFLFSPGAGGTLNFSKQEAYEIANFSVMFTSPDKRFEIGAYVDNAFGAKYALTRVTSQPWGLAESVAAPATYGVRLAINLGQ
jgi:iron complex outermembrane receptor protein